MNKRQEQEARILQLLKLAPEQKGWVEPDVMEQERLDKYERDIWTNIKNTSVIEVGKLDTLYGVEAFRIVATLPQAVEMEKLNEFYELGTVVRFVHPSVDVEAIKNSMEDGVAYEHMVTMTTINFEPTEGLF